MNTKFWISGFTGITLGLTSAFALAGYEWNYDEHHDFDDSDDNSAFVYTKPDSTHVTSGYQWTYDEHYDFDSSEDNSSFVHSKPDSISVSSGYQWVYDASYDFDDSENNRLSHTDVKRSTNGTILTTSSIITGMQ